MPNMPKSSNVLLAAAIGFIAGILLAPKSGKETREEIGERVDNVKGALRDGTKTVQAGVHTVSKEVNGMAKSIRGNVSDLADETKERSSRVAEQAKSTAKVVKGDVDRNVR
jgi:gas vesicle protein